MGLSEIFDSRGFNLVMLIVVILLLIVVIMNIVYYHHLRTQGGQAIGPTMSVIMMIGNIVLAIVLIGLGLHFLWRGIFHPAERAIYGAKIYAAADTVGTTIVAAKDRFSRVFDHDTVKIQQNGKVVSLVRMADGSYNTLKDGTGIPYRCDASRCEEATN